MEPFTTFRTSGFALDSLQLFQGAVHATVAPLLAECPVLHVAAGAEIRAQRDQACLYVVLRGALRRMPDDAQAPGESAGKILPGECVGELSVLDDEASGERVSAIEESDVLVIDGATLWKLVDESNGVARNLLRMLSFRVRAANAQLRRRRKVGEFYRQMSMVDGLTGLNNRAWLNEHLPALIDAAHESAPLSLIMLDLDHFKAFNDLHGHVCGDHALKVAAQAISGGLRPTDFAARFGGEELVVILPATGADGALLVAERLCERMRHSRVFSGPDKPLPHITASLGVATLEAGQHSESLISAADAALYRAKNAGRDRVAL